MRDGVDDDRHLLVSTAYAHTNIALVKYWGKREGLTPGLNLPAVGSLSLTLDRFGTETSVELDDKDAFVLNGHDVSVAEAQKVFRFLDRVRALAGVKTKAKVTSTNHVPTAAGLASSASAFAALALASAKAYGVDLTPAELSSLARQGSGSAARSVFGGFVVLERGVRKDGSDCFARPLEVASSLDVKLVVARCAVGKKDTLSTAGMEHTAETSPYYAAWVETHQRDLDDAEAAAVAGDLEKLGEVMEHSTLKMHATTLAARPGFFYFQPVTIAALLAVRALRGQGTGCWATMDAGPHVKVLCRSNDAAAVAAALEAVAGVVGVDICGAGPAASVRA